MRHPPLAFPSSARAAGCAAALVAAPALHAQRAAPPGRLSAELSVLGGSLPAALRDDDPCGGSAAGGLGLAVGAGYRLRAGRPVGLRVEGRLGAFGHPGLGNADCEAGPARTFGPTLPPPPGTVQREAGFDPMLADRRAFTQGRLVADLADAGRVLRVSAGGGTLLRIRAPFLSGGLGLGGRVAGALVVVEGERWWMRAPTLDRTTTWEALPVPPGAPSGYTPTRPVVTAERRASRALGVTWLRLSATLPLPGT